MEHDQAGSRFAGESMDSEDWAWRKAANSFPGGRQRSRAGTVASLRSDMIPGRYGEGGGTSCLLREARVGGETGDKRKDFGRGCRVQRKGE